MRVTYALILGSSILARSSVAFSGDYCLALPFDSEGNEVALFTLETADSEYAWPTQVDASVVTVDGVEPSVYRVITYTPEGEEVELLVMELR